MQDTPIYIDTFGILKAQQSADLMPQVSGLLKKRLFKEGSKVEEGELLYVIDPAEYEAALHKAQANLPSLYSNHSAFEFFLKNDNFFQILHTKP